MHKVKGAYYCRVCEKDVDVKISSVVHAVYGYDPVKVEVIIDVRCDECQTLLDKGEGIIVVEA